jgi:hypothetical protein
MKKVLLTVSAFFAAVIFTVSANAAVSSPCSGYTKPVKQEAPRAPKQVVEQGFKRDVLMNKVPVQTYLGGDARTDTATKYEETLVSGQE